QASTLAPTQWTRPNVDATRHAHHFATRKGVAFGDGVVDEGHHIEGKFVKLRALWSHAVDDRKSQDGPGPNLPHAGDTWNRKALFPLAAGRLLPRGIPQPHHEEAAVVAIVAQPNVVG